MDELTDYRAQIRAYLDRPDGRTSLRGLARRADMSPSMLSRVLSGERALDLQRAADLAAAMQLSGAEMDAFSARVAMVHGETEAIRRAAEMAVRRHEALADSQALPEGAAALQWPGVAVLEAVTLRGERALVGLAALLDPPTTEAAVSESVAALVGAGLLAYTADGLQPTFGTWLGRLDASTRADVLQGLVEDALGRAKRANRRLPGPQRAGGVVTLSLSRDRLPDLKRRCEQFLAEVAAMQGDDATSLVEIVLHAHPLTTGD